MISAIVTRDFVAMCDLNPATGKCRNDGAATSGVKASALQSLNSATWIHSLGSLNPYLDMVKQYGWANYMFQTNQGPGPYPAHQFSASAERRPPVPPTMLRVFSRPRKCLQAGAVRATAQAVHLPWEPWCSSLRRRGEESNDLHPCFVTPDHGGRLCRLCSHGGITCRPC